MRAVDLSELTSELFGGLTPRLETAVMEGARRWGEWLSAPIVDGVRSILTGVIAGGAAAGN